MNKKLIALIAVPVAALSIASCTSNRQANTVSHNLSVDADAFRVQRHIVFFNGITDKYLLEITGLCSLGNNDEPGKLSVTCKTGPNAFVKHILGLSDNVSYFMEQIESKDESTNHYKVVFRPETLIPDIDLS